jgi:hypothetical protein
MSRLVRARLKPLEDMPDWMKCCPEAIEALQNSIETVGIFLLDPESSFTKPGMCRFCEQEDPLLPKLRTPEGDFVFAAEIEIQEGFAE